MEKRNRDLSGVWILYTTIGEILWPLLIALKVFGLLPLGWIAVLTSCFWIPLLLLLATFALILALEAGAQLRRRLRIRKVERRIIRQAKAAGAWTPQAAGGKALELLAWKDFKIKRQPGESDRELRRRCMAAADREYANTPLYGSAPLDKICAGCWNDGCKANEALRGSKVDVCRKFQSGEIPPDAGAYQEEQEDW